MADIKQLAEEFMNLTVKEVSELANLLKEEYGLEPGILIKMFEEVPPIGQ